MNSRSAACRESTGRWSRLAPAAVLSAALAAQVPVPVPAPGPATQEPRPPGTERPDPSRAPSPDYRRTRDPDPLDPVWARGPVVQPFQGFPVFPSQLSGYGAHYPRAPGDRQLPVLPSLPPAPEETGWPQWVRARGKPPLVYAADKALLVRHADRVWWKAPDEDAFVPLYFHDKLRVVAPGTAVEVRQTGDFELLLHGGGRLVSLGSAVLRVEELTADRVVLRLAALTKLRFEAGTGEHVLLLPDGSSLTIPARPAGELPVTAGVAIDRSSEPGWYGGRAALFNIGQRPVQWTHPCGAVTLAPGERVGLFLTPPAAAIPQALATGEATVAADGGALRCTAAADTAVSWSGARFTLPRGAALRIDPLQGRPFAPASGEPPR